MTEHEQNIIPNRALCHSRGNGNPENGGIRWIPDQVGNDKGLVGNDKIAVGQGISVGNGGAFDVGQGIFAVYGNLFAVGQSLFAVGQGKFAVIHAKLNFPTRTAISPAMSDIHPKAATI